VRLLHAPGAPEPGSFERHIYEALAVRRRFLTGLIVDSVPAGRCCGAGWEAIVERGQTPVDSLDRPRIVLLSKTQRNAQRAIELIWDSVWIVNGGGIDLNEYPEVLPADGVESQDPWVERSEFGPLKADRWGFQTSGILEACMIAAKAS